MTRLCLALAVVVLCAMMLAAPARAQDHGDPDSLYFQVSALPTEAGLLAVNLWIRNDADTLGGVTAGFCWSNENMELDSVEFLDDLWWDHIWFDWSLQEANATQRFLYVGIGISWATFMMPDEDFRCVATYYFTLSSWQSGDSITIDTCAWFTGSEFSFCPLFHDCYRPGFGGVQVIDYGEKHIAGAGGEQNGALPATYSLDQNYPNPFNPSTSIQFSIPEGGPVSLSIYNVLGRKVRTLADGFFASGTHSFTWDGRDDDGALVSSGVYLYRIDAANFTQTRKMVLMK